MDRDKTVQYKSEKFAVRIVKLYKYLCENHREYDLFRQILRCGTSIGANIAEAEGAISTKDFLAKMYISFKECMETIYWLTLLYDTNYLKEPEYTSIKNDCEEIRKMLSSITKTLQKNEKHSSFLTPHS